MERIYQLDSPLNGSLRLEYVEEINFALVHRGVQPLYLCQLTNQSSEQWSEVCITLHEGDYTQESRQMLTQIPPGSTIDCPTLRLQIDVARLVEQTESVQTSARLSVTIDGVCALTATLELRLMPYNHWSGIQTYPDLLTCFVTPNRAVLSQISVKAAEILQRWTGDSALTEYQTQDPNKVRMQVASVYEALRSQGLVYASVPATFEQSGQRIRLVDQVLGEKLSNCLDLSLLFASCLESIGIRPIIVLLRGHAFVGAWLEPKYSATTVGDDASLLLKLSADGINELVLIESTALTSSANVGFEEAVQMALDRLHIEGEMQIFVDVYRARLSEVRPLPIRQQVDGVWQLEQTGVWHTNATDAIFELESLKHLITEGQGPLTKQMIWERKLLDLSLRNSLINIRLGKRIVPFISFDIAKLENELQQGRAYTINPCPSDVPITPEASGFFHSAQYAPALGTFVSHEIDAGRIYSYLNESDLQTGLKFVYRASRDALEENGANSLFVALGLLKWYESELSEKPRYAPILLLPVDIVRKGSGYTIRLRDEDMMLNITLVELLKQEFSIDLSGLDPLPQDEHGVDLTMVFSLVRHQIRDQKRWNVLEESLLGLFSFSKFVMWHDVHHNAPKLSEHPIVRALMSQGLTADDLPSLPEIDARVVDESHTPSDYALPIDVDSSQMEAVLEAGQGRSFVLHGPPGTGKSQTITNMIANALYQGKRVLFVAEKMAALSVVQSRLERIGLDPFCLELHSNKATKSHILAQLKQALELASYAQSPEFESTSSQLLAQRQELIAYTKALHEPHHLGLSLYDCINRYLSIETEALPLSSEFVAALDANGLQSRLDLLGEADVLRQVVGSISSHPLRGLTIEAYTSQTNEALRSTIERWLEQWSRLLTPQAEELSRRLGISISGSRADYLCLGALASAVMGAPTLSTDLLRLAPEERKTLAQTIAIGQKCAQMRTAFAEQYHVELLPEMSANARHLAQEWEAIQARWFLPRFFAKRSFLGRMHKFAPRVDATTLVPLLDELQEYERLRRDLEQSQGDLERSFGTLAQGERTAWADLALSVEHATALHAALLHYAQSRHLPLSEVLQGISHVFGADFSLFKQSFAPQLTEVSNAYSAIEQVEQQMRQEYRAELPDQSLATSLPQQGKTWLNHLDKLKDWYQWCVYRKRLIDEGLSEIVPKLEEGWSGAEASAALLRGICRREAETIIDADERLKLFNGLMFEQTIEKYRSLTKQFMALTKQELYRRLASRVPRMTMEPAATSEMGILKRNISNGGRGTSIRKLLDQIPDLLPRLCPCMLMSPMSVAQYIDLDAEKFDLVIFDEASQMPTSEAIGAIARGKTLVVVGDPKQMPPTSFFASSQVDEDEVELDDLESILDDCIALSMPSRYLTWHYRSKHESLIAFSNKHYYDGRLLTFPSADNRQSKLSLVSVDGVYDKGKSRSNRAEAEAIVQEVLRRLRDKELSRLSIGIVSFSQVQQNLIEDLLIDALSKEPELEQLAYSGEEPIFIKNLENVQGDERDVILFSVGYGPDASGRVSMNFGPLNNKGGERRLNVAVSRSRYEMIVFSTLRSEQIDLKRTQAKGVEGLKRFLEFAERGRLSDVQNAGTKTEAVESIAPLIARELEARGYQVDLSIGSSQFKVDLGVVDPEHPERYLLGILLDGSSYIRTKTARDREIVQPTVLELLKWQTMRIWSIDWYERRERVLERILDRLQNPTAPKPQEPTKPTNVPPTPAPPVQTPEPVLVQNQRSLPYEQAQISPRKDAGAERMLSSVKTVREHLHKIVSTEQPITSTLACKRLASIWQVNRITAKVQSFVDSLLIDYYLDPRFASQQEVYWLDEGTALSYESYRTDSGREIADCPMIEVMNATIAILEEQLSLSTAELKRMTAHLLGFSRMGSNLDQVTQTALALLERSGAITLDGDTARLTKS